MMTIFILTNGILMEVVNGISVECGERLWLAVLPARLHGQRGERKALMAASHLCLKRRGDNNQDEITKPLW